MVKDIGGWAAFVFVGVMILFAAVDIGYNLYMDTQHSTATDKILRLERITKDDNSYGAKSYYLVYCEKETFTIQDSVMNKRWNSSDLYGHLKVGSTYNFDVVSYRWDVISHYRNIITAEEV